MNFTRTAANRRVKLLAGAGIAALVLAAAPAAADAGAAAPAAADAGTVAPAAAATGAAADAGSPAATGNRKLLANVAQVLMQVAFAHAM